MSPDNASTDTAGDRAGEGGNRAGVVVGADRGGPGNPGAEPGTDAQRALSDYIRDPDHAPAPAGIEARRLKVYRELFFNNLQSLLAGNFPVIHRILTTPSDDDRWTPLIRDFYREHPSRTPLFTELAREFLRYLQHRADTARGDPPWLPELAHYEWVELALQISENVADAPGQTPAPTRAGTVAGEPLTRVALRLSALAWPFAYHWPVHRLAPDHLPEFPPAEPTFLLLQRDAAGTVHFQQLNALTFRLLDRIEQAPGLHAHTLLHELAEEARASSVAAFIDQGTAMLQQLCDAGVVIAVPASRDESPGNRP